MYFTSTCEVGGHNASRMSCVSKSRTDLFSIRKDNLEYVRSTNYGGGDSIYIAYGKCEKF